MAERTPAGQEQKAHDHNNHNSTPEAEDDQNDPKVALQRVLEQHSGERHIAVIQDYPDPDAISSAFAHRLISARFNINVDIVYAGRISHHQNIALVKLLGLPLHAYNDKFDLSVYQGSAYIDCQRVDHSLTEALDAAHIPPVALIDHHERQEYAPKAEFIDIRRTGSAATMYTEYIEGGLLQFDRGEREHVVAATALMHGLMTDTTGFVRANQEDFEAAAFLAQFYDANILLGIMSQQRSKQVMDIIQTALRNRVLRENYSIAGIGYVRSEDRDAIPQAADFLLTEENVHTAIVYGIVVSDSNGQRSETVIGSLRTIKLTIDPDAFMKEALGRSGNGQFFGGGKPEAGGFEIPVGFLTDGPDDMLDLKWQVFDAHIKQRLFAKIGINQ